MKTNEKFTNRNGLKYDRFGFVDLTEKVKINDRGYLYFLICLVACGGILALFQPANALNFIHPGNQTGQIGEFEPAGNESIIDNIRAEIKRNSEAGAITFEPQQPTGKSQGGPGQDNSPKDSNSKPEVITEKEAMPEVKTDLDKLAHAVSVAETSGCIKGYALTHNNCFGIKKGNTYPCKTKGKSKMCNFSSKEESFTAFKVIWTKVYGGGFPTRTMAAKWTGNSNPKNWLNNVSKHFYD